MVSIRERIFLICGADFSQRQRALTNLKNRILKNSPLSLNSITFYSKELDSKTLKEKLFVSSFGKNKVVIFKNFFEMKAQTRILLFNNLKKILTTNYIICETDKDHYQLQSNKRLISDKLFALVLKRAALFRVASSKRKVSIQDFMSSIRKSDLTSSLYILESLFEAGAKDKVLGPQVIGILVRNFSYLKNPVEKDRAFKYLWEADRAIKEKGLAPRLVIETLLVRLFTEH